MSITFHSSVIITKYWTDFKTLTVDLKSLPIQFDIDTDSDNQKYVIFAIDDKIAYICNIWLNLIPSEVLNFYSQEQNDIDKADFEASFMSNTNTKIATNTNNLKYVYDLTDSSVIYVGTAPLGTTTDLSSWLIKKVELDVDGNPTAILYSDFTAIWDDRFTETYN